MTKQIGRCKGTTRCTVQKKKPITVKHLYKLYNHSGGKCTSLANLHGYFNEVINKRRTDVVIKNTHIVIFIEKSKTDVYQEGSSVSFTKLSSVLVCLFAIAGLLTSKKIVQNVFSQQYQPLETKASFEIVTNTSVTLELGKTF